MLCIEWPITRRELPSVLATLSRMNDSESEFVSFLTLLSLVTLSLPPSLVKHHVHLRSHQLGRHHLDQRPSGRVRTRTTKQSRLEFSSISMVGSHRPQEEEWKLSIRQA